MDFQIPLQIRIHELELENCTGKKLGTNPKKHPPKRNAPVLANMHLGQICMCAGRTPTPSPTNGMWDGLNQRNERLQIVPKPLVSQLRPTKTNPTKIANTQKKQCRPCKTNTTRASTTPHLRTMTPLIALRDLISRCFRSYWLWFGASAQRFRKTSTASCVCGCVCGSNKEDNHNTNTHTHTHTHAHTHTHKHATGKTHKANTVDQNSRMVRYANQAQGSPG